MHVVLMQILERDEQRMSENENREYKCVFYGTFPPFERFRIFWKQMNGSGWDRKWLRYETPAKPPFHSSDAILRV